MELKDHVPNGQTVTSLLRFNTFNMKQTYNESMSGGKGVAAVTTLFNKSAHMTVPLVKKQNLTYLFRWLIYTFFHFGV